MRWIQSTLWRWLIGAALGLVLLLGMLAAVANWWLGSGDFRSRIEQQATQALGLPVTLEAVQLSVWPAPGVALKGLTLHSSPPITAGRIVAAPQWLGLLEGVKGGRIALNKLTLSDVVLPQRGLHDALQKIEQHSAKTRRHIGDSTAKPGALPVERPGQQPGGASSATSSTAPSPPSSFVPSVKLLRVEGLRWESEQGWASTFAADVQLNDAMLPQRADLRVLAGRWQGARLQAKADLQALGATAPSVEAGAPQGSWQLDLAIAGGTVRGPLRLGRAGGVVAAGPSRTLTLEAALQTRDVSVQALTGLPVLSGRLEADTRLNAQAESLSALARALRSQTRFTVQGAVIDGLDLVKAVRTLGISRGGQTRLDTLAGQVATQESVQGRATQLSALNARSGLLAATGQVNIAPDRQLAGRISVDLPGGVLGVPLQVGGTLAAPQVTLTRGAMLGAAVGTLVMPGAGTGAGAKLGDKLGEGLKGLFGK